MVRASCDAEYDMIVVSKDSFVEEGYSLEQPPLKEPCDEEVVKVMLMIWNLLIPISINCPPKSTLTSIIWPPSSLFHPSIDPSMLTFLTSETCMIYVFNFDPIHELDVAIGLENWVEDIGFLSSLFIEASCETFKPLSSALNDVQHVCNSYNWA